MEGSISNKFHISYLTAGLKRDVEICRKSLLHRNLQRMSVSVVACPRNQILNTAEQPTQRPKGRFLRSSTQTRGKLAAV